MFIPIPLGFIVPLILAMLKNPQQKKKVRKIMLEIFRAIKAAYADDADFE